MNTIKEKIYLDKKIKFAKACDAITQAAQKNIKTVILPFKTFLNKKDEKKLCSLAISSNIEIERGGFDFSLFIKRNLLLFHKELFRMEGGKRKNDHHFCPTNNKSHIEIKKEAKKLFEKYKDVRLFHLWPDENNYHAWCSCPSCRAFTEKEQNIMAVSIVADCLAQVLPKARICYFDNFEDTESYNGPAARANMVRIKTLPTIVR